MKVRVFLYVKGHICTPQKHDETNSKNIVESRAIRRKLWSSNNCELDALFGIYGNIVFRNIRPKNANHLFISLNIFTLKDNV